MGQTKKNLFTTKEKALGIVYMLSLFLLVFGACSYLLFFSNPDFGSSSGKALALEQMKRINSFKEFQEERMEKIKALDDKVNSIDPGLNASYEKNEIRFVLGQFNDDYIQNKYDDRYRIFSLISKFYEYKLFDKERIWTSKKNIEQFVKDNEICQGCVEALNNK